MHEQHLFLNEEEIITDMLLYRLTEAEKVTFRHVDSDELKETCHEFCQPLIRHYRLDDENNPHTSLDITHHNYPARVSYRIVAKVWARLTNKPVPADLEPALATPDASWF